MKNPRSISSRTRAAGVLPAQTDKKNTTNNRHDRGLSSKSTSGNPPLPLPSPSSTPLHRATPSNNLQNSHRIKRFPHLPRGVTTLPPPSSPKQNRNLKLNSASVTNTYLPHTTTSLDRPQTPLGARIKSNPGSRQHNNYPPHTQQLSIPPSAALGVRRLRPVHSPRSGSPGKPSSVRRVNPPCGHASPRPGCARRRSAVDTRRGVTVSADCSRRVHRRWAAHVSPCWRVVLLLWREVRVVAAIAAGSGAGRVAGLLRFEGGPLCV